MPTSPVRISVIGAALAAALLLAGCAPGGATTPSAGDQGDGGQGSGGQPAAVPLPEDFPSDRVPLAPGTIVKATPGTELGESGDFTHIMQWFVWVSLDAGSDLDTVTELLEGAGWTWEQDNPAGTEAQRWFSSGDDSVTVVISGPDDIDPNTLSYKVNFALD